MYKKIMVPLDGSDLAECVLPHVEGFVTGCQLETIIFVRVIEQASYSLISRTASPQDHENMRKNLERMEKAEKAAAETYLSEVINRIKHGETKFKMEVLIGKVADSLVDYAAAIEADLILIATHGRSGISRWVRGSIADRVLRSSSSPVLMVRADNKIRAKKL
jgi:nucleotide-binding universal stress UspA family protein